MPQMAPMYWLYLFFFFMTVLLLFLMVNYFIKPFSCLNLYHRPTTTNFKSWKL
uniref:ATP synthase F0 subunit 8 n=1 Tax=Ilyoplax deschampsi TaxID=78102 RepID=K9K1S1_9EUCA|nr:ATP synthase F0 subunit 8 [Ilyoplax deschampsi]AEH05071.1 ATP synthase F0 subunit 8 [Ilyoplax deschampsi]